MLKFLTVLCLCLAALLPMALPASAADASVVVKCVVGKFVFPKGAAITYSVARDDYLKDPPPLTPKELDDDETRKHQQCQNKNVVSLKAISWPLPYTVSRGVLERRVTIIGCVADGAYLFNKVLAPAKNFTYNFSEKDKVSASNKLVKQYCK